MTARCKSAPNTLALVFERNGEPDVRIEVQDGDKALLRAVAFLLAHQRLQAGDRLTVLPANE